MIDYENLSDTTKMSSSNTLYFWENENKFPRPNEIRGSLWKLAIYHSACFNRINRMIQVKSGVLVWNCKLELILQHSTPDFSTN